MVRLKIWKDFRDVAAVNDKFVGVKVTVISLAPIVVGFQLHVELPVPEYVLFKQPGILFPAIR